MQRDFLTMYNRLEIYLSNEPALGMLPLKKHLNRDKCSFATKQRMFGVFAIDEPRSSVRALYATLFMTQNTLFMSQITQNTLLSASIARIEKSYKTTKCFFLVKLFPLQTLHTYFL